MNSDAKAGAWDLAATILREETDRRFAAKSDPSMTFEMVEYIFIVIAPSLEQKAKIIRRRKTT